jgi:hypothetical protein
MCGGECPCDGSGCGGCEYGCWGAMDGSTCVAKACCDKPSPTCGCCEDILDGETCLNDTYYITFPINTVIVYNGINYTQCYISFQFENCLSCPSPGGVSTDDGIFNFMVWWYQCTIIDSGYNSGKDFISACSSLTKTKPDNSFLNVNGYYNGSTGCCNNITYAEHSFFWPEEVDSSVTNWKYGWPPDLNGTETSTEAVYATPSGLAFTSYCLDNCTIKYPSYASGSCMSKTPQGYWGG